MKSHLSKSEQTLCVTQSRVSAVQASRDCSHGDIVSGGRQQPNKQAETIWLPVGRGTRSVALDAEDLPLVASLKWYLVKSHDIYYAMSTTGVLMHRLLMGVHGLGRSVEVDHRDGDGLNNRRQNLRIATRSVNLQNRRKFPGGTSKYRGVKRSNNGQRWLARIYHNKKPILLGTHDTEEQAARAYDKMALVLFGPDARLNLPSPALPSLFLPPTMGSSPHKR